MDQTCSQCGHRSREEDPRFCSACGWRMDGSSPPVDPENTIRHENTKNPQIAVFCSSLIPGLGQLYNGETLKGLAFLIGTLIGLFLLVIPGVAVWVYSMYDAHIIAGKMNDGILAFRPMNPFYMVVFVISSVFIFIAVVVAITVLVISTMLSQLSPAGSADFFRMLDAGGRFI